MFKNKSKDNGSNQTSSTSTLPAGATNSLVSGTKVEGNIVATSDIRIDGELIGSLDCSGRVIIGPDGSVEGDISCKEAVIEGRFKGQLRVDEQLNVRETAEIDGDVVTGKLNVQPGAIFNVSCNMGGQTIKAFKPKVEAEAS